jgi:hypothetical protein
VQLAEGFLADAPGDRLFERLVHIARDALTRHLASAKPAAPAVTAHDKPEPVPGTSTRMKGPEMAA